MENHGHVDHHHHHHHLSLETNTPNIHQSPEQIEWERRWPIALKELTVLVERIKDIRRANPDKLPLEMANIENKQITRILKDELFQAIKTQQYPNLKPSVIRRMANKIGDYLLWRRVTTIPVIHELIVLLPWWISHMPSDVISTLRDIGLKYILNGIVIPVQQVWKDILDAQFVYLGHCVCRSAGIIDDLKKDNRVFTILNPEQNQMLLDRMMQRYRSLKEQFGNHLPSTAPRYIELFEELEAKRQSGATDYRLETLIEKTYPDWEILPVLDKYTQSWIRSMHTNYKAHLIHKELAFELATILYATRGAIFSSMRLIETPYTICCCPTPEAGGGCVLTNWYYWGMSNTSLLPNEADYGRRKDKNGNVLTCQFFPIRGKRKCLGCGCNHQAENPKDLGMFLHDADTVYSEWQQKK
ncbi:MAG: hypothetical protein HQK77_15500 [Desulfobacterales bacterium]|nr:hypothetical protein [Desulfobacterales bacterium]